MSDRGEKREGAAGALPAGPTVRVETLTGNVRMVFSGNWRTGTPPPAGLAEARLLVDDPRTTSIDFAAENLGDWDSSLMAPMTAMAQTARTRGISCDTTGLPEGVGNLLRLALTVPPNTEAGRKVHVTGFFEAVGGMTLAIPGTVRSVFNFIGDVTLGFGRLLTGRSACTARNVWLQIQECGAEALPITSLISMLVGLILAFVGVLQLSMFGAQIYVASLVAVGMTRIMGAIMTGIILAGRTGASFAAVIGTMQVNEEIDALHTTGISPMDFLVMPRLIALTLMTPLLVLYADFMGMLGGYLVGVLIIGLNPQEYFTFSKVGFTLNNMWVGLVHGAVFGMIIALTGCYQGLQCGRSAEAVGKATTSAVVTSIVGLVLATSVLTILFNILKI